MHQPRLNQKAFWVQGESHQGPDSDWKSLSQPPQKTTYPSLLTAWPLLLSIAICWEDAKPAR